jgi:hypothetical protein
VVICALAAGSSGIVSGVWSYGSLDRIPPGYRVVAIEQKMNENCCQLQSKIFPEKVEAFLFDLAVHSACRTTTTRTSCQKRRALCTSMSTFGNFLPLIRELLPFIRELLPFIRELLPFIRKLFATYSGTFAIYS